MVGTSKPESEPSARKDRSVTPAPALKPQEEASPLRNTETTTELCCRRGYPSTRTFVVVSLLLLMSVIGTVLAVNAMERKNHTDEQAAGYDEMMMVSCTPEFDFRGESSEGKTDVSLCGEVITNDEPVDGWCNHTFRVDDGDELTFLSPHHCRENLTSEPACVCWQDTPDPALSGSIDLTDTAGCHALVQAITGAPLLQSFSLACEGGGLVVSSSYVWEGYATQESVQPAWIVADSVGDVSFWMNEERLAHFGVVGSPLEGFRVLAKAKFHMVSMVECDPSNESDPCEEINILEKSLSSGGTSAQTCWEFQMQQELRGGETMEWVISCYCNLY